MTQQLDLERLKEITGYLATEKGADHYELTDSEIIAYEKESERLTAKINQALEDSNRIRILQLTRHGTIEGIVESLEQNQHNDECKKALEFYDKAAQVYQINHPTAKNFNQVLDYILKLQHDEMWATQYKLDAESKLQQAEQKIQKIEEAIKNIDITECDSNTIDILNELQSILKEGDKI